jgi:hypothetical protein
MATLSPEAGAGDGQDLGVMGQAILLGNLGQRLTGLNDVDGLDTIGPRAHRMGW